MKWKNRITNYNFWISIVSATLLILQAFNIKLDIANINEIVTALLGLLVVIGIINDPTKSAKDTENDAKSTNKKKVGNKQIEPSKTENKAEKDVEDVNQKGENKQQNEENQIDNKDLNIVENEHETMPIAKQNENDFDLAENDLQVLVDKIAQDLEQKYAELNKAVDMLNKTQIKQPIDKIQNENNPIETNIQSIEPSKLDNENMQNEQPQVEDANELNTVEDNLIIPTNNVETKQENISFNIVN